MSLENSVVVGAPFLIFFEGWYMSEVNLKRRLMLGTATAGIAASIGER
jgi:hypothetical protein